MYKETLKSKLAGYLIEAINPRTDFRPSESLRRTGLRQMRSASKVSLKSQLQGYIIQTINPQKEFRLSKSRSAGRVCGGVGEERGPRQMYSAYMVTPNWKLPGPLIDSTMPIQTFGFRKVGGGREVAKFIVRIRYP